MNPRRNHNPPRPGAFRPFEDKGKWWWKFTQGQRVIIGPIGPFDTRDQCILDIERVRKYPSPIIDNWQDDGGR